MFQSQKRKYESQNYKQWITLPPQIPIPYNQDYISLLSLQISNLSYLNTFIFKRKDPQNNNDQYGDENYQSKSELKIKTYWWGEQHGFQSLIKTLVNNDYKKQTHLSPYQNEEIIKSNSKANNQIKFEPVNFLICCPLENFLKYCLDMKVLRIQLISVETNTKIAKTYLNFMTLSNSWKGQPSRLLLPLFSASQSGRPFVNNPKNPKIVGQITLDIKIEQMVNPYKIVPQSLGSINKIQQSRNNKDYFSNNKDQREMKENDSVSPNIQVRTQDLKQRKKTFKKQNFSNTSSQVQKYSLSQQQNQISLSQHQDHIINTQVKPNQQNKQSERYCPSNNKVQNQFSIKNIVPSYEKINLPKYNFESQKIQLNEDFKMIFGVKNKFYQQIFSSKLNTNTIQSTNPTNKSHQTIEFKIQLVQNQSLIKNQKQLIFENIQISVPILDSSNNQLKPYRINEYILAQKEGVIKIELETAKFSAKQIEKFIKQAQFRVQIRYELVQRKQVQLQSKGGRKQMSEEKNLMILKGSQSLLTILSKSGVPNRLSLNSKNRKYQNMCEFYVTALPKQNEVENRGVQNRVNNRVDKGREESRRVLVIFYVWLRVQKFIPINANYFRDSNIFIKIGLLSRKSDSKNENGNGLKSNELDLRQIAQTNTLWKAFESGEKLATFKQEMVTFPVQVTNQQQQICLKLQLINRQQKQIKIGESISVIRKSDTNDIKDIQSNKEKGGNIIRDSNVSKGRLELQVRDIKNETVGYLQCWIEQGDINYINKLIAAHLHSRNSNNIDRRRNNNNSNYDGRESQQRQSVNQRNTNMKIKSNTNDKRQQEYQEMDQRGQHPQQHSDHNSSSNSSSNSYSQQQSSHPSGYSQQEPRHHYQHQLKYKQQHQHQHEQQSLIIQELNRFQELINININNNKDILDIHNEGILGIHNRLFLHIILAISNQHIQEDFIDNFKNKHLNIINHQQTCYIKIDIFCQFIAQVFIPNRDQRSLVPNKKQEQLSINRVKQVILQRTQSSSNYWVSRLFSFYSVNNNRSYSNNNKQLHSRNSKQFHSLDKNYNQLMDLGQLLNSYQAFVTFYKQIIQEKDYVFKRFLQLMSMASIEITDIQQDLIYEVNKQDLIHEVNKVNNNRSEVDLVTQWKNRILERVLRASRVNNINDKVQIQTVIERFFLFYRERISQIKTNKLNKSNKYRDRLNKLDRDSKYSGLNNIGISHNVIVNISHNVIVSISHNLVSIICDQLRRFQLYETTYSSQIEGQYFKQYISKTIRQLLSIQHYISIKDLLNIVDQNQIELSKWELLNLSDKCINSTQINNQQQQQSNQRNVSQSNNNVSKQKVNNRNSKQKLNNRNSKQRVNNNNNSNQKVIVKSPTFGILQHLHTLNPKSNNYNPSFLQNKNNKLKPLNISELSDDNKEKDRSYILRKKIQMISPINKISSNVEINNNKMNNKGITPVSRKSKNREVSSYMNPSSLLQSNGNQSNLQNNIKSQQNQYSSYQSKTNQNLTSKQDMLIVGLMDMKRTVKWIRVGKNTYFIDENINNSITNIYQNIKHQLSSYSQNNTHSFDKNVQRSYMSKNIKDMSSYEVHQKERSQMGQINQSQTSKINQSQQEHGYQNQKEVNYQSNNDPKSNIREDVQNSKQNQNNQSEDKSQNINERKQQISEPIIIPLQGIQPKPQYNLVIAVSTISQPLQNKNQSLKQKPPVSKLQKTLKQQTEEIFINCEHGLDQKIIDQNGLQIGSLILCLLSDICPSQQQH